MQVPLFTNPFISIISSSAELDHTCGITGNGPVYAGERHTLICTATAGLPRKVIWTDGNGNTLSNNSAPDKITVGEPRVDGLTTQLNLSFTPVTTSLAGQYQCLSTVEIFRETVSATLNLTVKS